MSSTMCFTSKGHSTRIAPPLLEKSAGDTKRFEVRILFAGLFFVLLFGLFVLPVAGEDNIDDLKLRVLSVDTDNSQLYSIDSMDVSYSYQPIIFAVDVIDTTNIDINQNPDVTLRISGSSMSWDVQMKLTSNTRYIDFTDEIRYPCGLGECSAVVVSVSTNEKLSNTVTFTLTRSNPIVPFEGIGTSDNPYLIKSESDLITLSNLVSAGNSFEGGHFLLTEDIDLSGLSWQPIGNYIYLYKCEDSDSLNWYNKNTNVNLRHPFCGIFDGGNHEISGLSLSQYTDNRLIGFSGLFGYINSGAVLKNIHLKDVILNTPYTGYLTGALVGVVCADETDVTIDNCHVEGSYSDHGSYLFGHPAHTAHGGSIGYVHTSKGLVTITDSSVTIVNGDVSGGFIDQLYADDSGQVIISSCSVDISNTASVRTGFVYWVQTNAATASIKILDCFVDGVVSSEYDDVSGFIWSIYTEPLSNGIIVENCYSSASVTCDVDNSGIATGFIAVNSDGIIQNCVALNPSVSANSIHRFCGYYSDENFITDNNYVLSSMNCGDATDGVDLSPTDAVTQTFYEDTLGWDFDTVWKMDSSVSPYPILQQLPVIEPAEEYTITFDADGGTGSMTSATVSAGDSYTLPDCTFTAPEGQVFKAWLIGSTEYAAGTSYTPTGDVTAYAVWVDSTLVAPGSFSITYPSNGGVLTSTDVIEVKWTEANGATSYVFTLRDLTIHETSAEGKVIPDTDIGNVLTYTIDSTYLIDGHNYRVAVCAVNDAGNIWQNAEFSINTQALLAGVPTMQLPSASGVYYTGNDITVTWTAPATNPDSYTIWLYDGGNDAVSFTGITGNTYTIPGSNFANAGSYSVEVYAIKEGYLQDKPGNVLFEVKINFQHTTAVNVDITYNGITKDFPQDAGDGRTHYWYVNKVCDDCKTVLESNVQSTAVHNANTLEKNGVCECNYHTITAGLSKTMYAVEDTNTYLAPEASDGYHGGSIDKDEEVTVLAEGLGVDGSWSLIQYSVTSTPREKVRFVKSESLKSNEEVTITIFYPTEDTLCLANENPEIHWISSKDTVEKYEVKLYSEDNRLLGQAGVILGSNGIYNYKYTIPENYILGGTKSYKVVVSALSNSEEVIGEDTVSFKIENPFTFPDDTWGFDNTYPSFKPFLEKHIQYTLYGNPVLYYFTWDDYAAVCGYDEISKKIYEEVYGYNEEDDKDTKERKSWGGSCFGMVMSVMGAYNKLIPESGFMLNGNTYSSLYEINREDMFATHSSFDGEKTENIGHYIHQLQIYQQSVAVQENYYGDKLNKYDDIISLIEDKKEIVYIGMHGSTAHAVIGYAVNRIPSNSNVETIHVTIYDPNYPGEKSYLIFLCEDGTISEWSYNTPKEKNKYSSNDAIMFYMSEYDVTNTCYSGFNNEQFQFKYQDELVYITKFVGSTWEEFERQLTVVDRTGEAREIHIFCDTDDYHQTKLYRIPKDVVEIQSPSGGEITIMDTHSSVELTLDAGTTASVIVDDTKESSVEITSDDENTNHEFTVTYGYDSTADKGYQEATVKGTMSDSFKGEATENGLKLTGLDSTEILVENSKGESVSVGTIQNADEYEDIVIDIDTSVKVTGNKDGVSDVLVSVPLNKVQYESSGSSKDTGSGNYAEYPRSVTNGGYVDFGTSPVVKGVTLPEGVSGKVMLIAKSETPAPEGKEAYGVFEINVDSYPIGEKAVISFTIPLSDLQKKGFTEKDICLYHFDGEVWTKLPTTYTVEGDKVFYEAETTAFSPFAIVYEKDGATSAAVSEIPVEPENPSDEPVSTVPEIPSSSEPQETESPAPVLGMMLGGLGAAVLMRRK